MPNVLHTRELTRLRIWLAYAIAVLTDGLQLLLGPAGWAGFDEGADVVTMVLLTAVLGFHPLFLPTFVIELLPISDMLPTWTGCVMMVIALRRRSVPPEVKPQPPAQPPVIDI
jgi:hypothetical protein